MITSYLVIVLAVVAWKGYYAFLRAMKSYKQDREQHDSLREYLLANGATPFQSMWPFYRHALQRAFIPMAAQWRLWGGLLLLGIVMLLLRSC
jgi:ABC-type iron transport system FetAB permease component